MTNTLEEINNYLDAHQADFVAYWRELVNHQAGTYEIEKITDLLEKTKTRFEKEGLTCHFVTTAKAPVLVAFSGKENPGKPILISGHLDTVFPSGSYPDPAFREENGVVYGPGVADMKGGVAMALYIVKALRHLGYTKHPLKIVLVGDEENTHMGTNAAEILEQEAQGCLFALNMETGRMDNCLSTGRKGAFDCHITVKGKGAHAGNLYYEGRNAIAEMAHKILALQNLSNKETGTTVNVGVISGGTVSNAVPNLCKIQVDIRFVKADQYPIVKKQIEEVCAKTYIEGTTTTLEFFDPMPVFEQRPENMAMLAKINEQAKAMGYEEFGSVFPGGSSDISFITLANIPAICSCGAQGDGAHTMEERAFIEPSMQRMKILTAMLKAVE